MSLKPKNTESKVQDGSPKFNWNVFLVILLLLFVVGLPIAISVWEIGEPIKGYSV